MSVPNIWQLRNVAEGNGRPCWIDFKTTTSALFEPNSKTTLFTCRSHLTDRGFCTPIIDKEEGEKKKRKEEIEREIEVIKKEYEEKMKKKGKGKDKDKDKDKEAEKEKDEKIKEIEKKGEASSTEELPRLYNLHRIFHQKAVNMLAQRQQRLTDAERSKNNFERLKDPSSFPSVPSSNP